jgi:hypothetical protein
MFAIREEIPTDVAPREALLDACFGPQRFAKTSERLREGRLPADGLALTLSARAGSWRPCACGTSRRARGGPPSCSGPSPSIPPSRAWGSARSSCARRWSAPKSSATNP